MTKYNIMSRGPLHVAELTIWEDPKQGKDQ